MSKTEKARMASHSVRKGALDILDILECGLRERERHQNRKAY